MAYIYRHIRLDKNEPFYIGIGSDTMGKYTRANFIKNRNNYWKNIIAKTEYRVDILLDDLTWEEACEKEKEFIKLYGRFDCNNGILCNMTDGGEGLLGNIVSNYTRIKMGISQLGNQKYKLRKTPQCEINKKISIANKGKVRTQETINKLSQNASGKNNSNYGLKMSEEQKNKIRNSCKCFIVHQFDLNENLIKIWPSTKSVIKGGFNQSNVRKCCNNISKTHKNYIWKYGK